MPTVDADTHIIESEAMWDCLEGDDRKYRPQFVDAEARFERGWHIDGRFVWADRGNDALAVEVRELTDPAARVAKMDALGIDIQVIYPSVFVTPVTDTPHVQVPLCRAYNRFLAKATAGHRDRLRWAVVPPLASIPDALAELEFGKQNGACAVMLRGVEGDRLFSDEFFTPLFEKAAALDLAVCVHSGIGNAAVAAAVPRDFYFAFVLPVVTAFNGILGGRVPERHPSLRFGFIEAGAMWVPMLVREVNRRYERLGGGEQYEEGGVMAANRLYVTTRTDNDIAYILKWSGEHNLVLGTDFGHMDVQSELHAMERLRDNPDLPAGVIDKILDANSRALYGLPG